MKEGGTRGSFLNARELVARRAGEGHRTRKKKGYLSPRRQAYVHIIAPCPWHSIVELGFPSQLYRGAGAGLEGGYSAFDGPVRASRRLIVILWYG